MINIYFSSAWYSRDYFASDLPLWFEEYFDSLTPRVRFDFCQCFHELLIIFRHMSVLLLAEYLYSLFIDCRAFADLFRPRAIQLPRHFNDIRYNITASHIYASQWPLNRRLYSYSLSWCSYDAPLIWPALFGTIRKWALFGSQQFLIYIADIRRHIHCASLARTVKILYWRRRRLDITPDHRASLFLAFARMRIWHIHYCHSVSQSLRIVTDRFAYWFDFTSVYGVNSRHTINFDRLVDENANLTRI